MSDNMTTNFGLVRSHLQVCWLDDPEGSVPHRTYMYTSPEENKIVKFNQHNSLDKEDEVVQQYWHVVSLFQSSSLFSIFGRRASEF